MPATQTYVSVAEFAISPSAAGTVCPGDPVTLTPAEAAPYVAARQLVLQQPAPSPTTTKTVSAAPPEGDPQ
jgi:hypothetical protein